MMSRRAVLFLLGLGSLFAALGAGVFGIARLIGDASTSFSLARERRRPHEIEVPAESLWTKTGIEISEGDRVTIRASGSVTLSHAPGYDSPVSADGFLGSPCQTNENSPCLLFQAPYGGLIARIGEGEAFYVGRDAQIDAPWSGQLLVAVNDNIDLYDDNDGMFTVRVSITR